MAIKLTAGFTYDAKATNPTKTVHSVEVEGLQDLIGRLANVGITSEEDVCKLLYGQFAISVINSGARKEKTSADADAFIEKTISKMGGTVETGISKTVSISAEDKAKAKMLAEAGISAEQLAQMIANMKG